MQPSNSIGAYHPGLLTGNQTQSVTTNSPTNPAAAAALFPQPLPPIQLSSATNSTTQINDSSSLLQQNPNSSGFYPQILYWYPTPPVSPSSAIYIHPSSMLHPATAYIIVLRGVPLNATVPDIMHFMNGFPEVILFSFLFNKIKLKFKIIIKKVSPECIQIQRTPDGRSTGDVLVSFFNRSEAERAILEKNHQTIGNRIIELYLAV